MASKNVPTTHSASWGARMQGPASPQDMSKCVLQYPASCISGEWSREKVLLLKCCHKK